MKIKKYIQLIFILIILLIINNVYSYAYHNNFYNDKKNPNKYQKALKNLAYEIRSTHPALSFNDYKNINRKNFTETSENIIKKLGEKTKNNNTNSVLYFYYYTLKLLAILNDGHADIIHNFKHKELKLPITIMHFQDGFYITHATDLYKELENKKIIEINYTPITEIAEKIYPYIPADNIYNKKYIIDRFINSKTLLDIIKVINSDDKGVNIKYTNINEMEYYKTFIEFTRSYKNIQRKNIGRNSITNQENTLFVKYNIIKEKDVVYLQLNEFYDIQADPYISTDFRNVYKKLFSDIKKHNINNLVIDLRNNTGGVPETAMQLIAYLKNENSEKLSAFFMLLKPSKYISNWNYNKLLHIREISGYELIYHGFKNSASIFNTSGTINLKHLYIFNEYGAERLFKEKVENDFFMPYPDEDMIFDGNVYLFVDSGTFSLGSWITALMKDNDYAVVIGEPTGCASVSHTSGAVIPIDNIDASAYISPAMVVRADEKALSEEYDAVYPDIIVPLKFKDHISNTDPVWDYTINNILNEN